MKSSFKLVLGTHNLKKRAELVRLIGRRKVQLMALSDFSRVVEVEETGSSFGENAQLKAIGYARQLHQWVLAEDSGLSVNALDGAPGVYSARFSGDHATDQSNNQLLLEKLAGLRPEKRQASYTCQIAVADPDGMIHAQSQGHCHGRILTLPRGDAGFGYDPLFEIPEYDQTFAEMGDSVKAVLSHRARAYRQLLPQLLAIINSQSGNQ